jgi:hypothetical protein
LILLNIIVVGPYFFSDVGHNRGNPEIEQRARKSGDKFSENVHIIANEPSLALYRIQEHVRKSLPQLVEQKVSAVQLHLTVYDYNIMGPPKDDS